MTLTWHCGHSISLFLCCQYSKSLQPCPTNVSHQQTNIHCNWKTRNSSVSIDVKHVDCCELCSNRFGWLLVAQIRPRRLPAHWQQPRRQPGDVQESLWRQTRPLHHWTLVSTTSASSATHQMRSLTRIPMRYRLLVPSQPFQQQQQGQQPTQQHHLLP